MLKTLQPVVRFERFYPVSSGSDNGKVTTLGVNWFLSKNNQKLQLAHLWTEKVKG